MRDCIEKETAAFENFEERLTAFEASHDYKGLLTYLLSLKEELLSLPISHKSAAMTI